MSVATEFGRFEWQDPCWISEPISVPVLNGASVRLQIFPERKDISPIITESEISVLRRFLSLPHSRSAEIIPHLRQYYNEMWESVGPPDIPEIPSDANIWDHVQPRTISLDADESGTLYINVEAECDWEIEHGLQLVLQNGERWARVSSYSGHLTDGQAYGRSALDRWMDDPSATLPVRTLNAKLAARRD